MLNDIYKQLVSLQKQIDNLVEPEVESASDKATKTIALFQLIPGLVGFWPMSSVQRSTGNAYDLSGQGRTLTYNGNPTFSIYNNLTPYVDLDGTGDYLSRADETDLDILGTETVYASSNRGLTMGGWFWFDDAPGATETMMSKFTSAPAVSYYLERITGGQIMAVVSGDGTFVNAKTATSSVTPSTGSWFFCAGRYIPSTSLSVFLNSHTPVTNTTAIPASIFNSSAPFQISGFNSANQVMDGRASLCFLSANALPDAWISRLYRQSKGLFGL